MKYINSPCYTAAIFVSAVLWTGLPSARADLRDLQQAQEQPAQPAEPPEPPSSTAPGQNSIVIQTIEPDGKSTRHKDVAWLGVAVEEISDALSSQLGLEPGEGLTVDLLAEGSPAAKADLRKHDVLVDLDGQMLVDPHQFRKLVRMHAEGDTVKLTYYRGGRKQTISVKLSKNSVEEANDTEMVPLPGDLQNLKLELKGLNGDLRGMSESLTRAGLDKSKVDQEVKRTMEQTRKALQDAVQRATVDRHSLVSVDRQLEALARNGVDVDRDATVTIRSKRNSSRTMVETDDTGTYVIEAGATTHLIARDQHGKLLFDGEIDTRAEREKVPKDVWTKAKRMLDQIVIPSGDEPKTDDKSGDKPNSRNNSIAGVSYQCG